MFSSYYPQRSPYSPYFGGARPYSRAVPSYGGPDYYSAGSPFDSYAIPQRPSRREVLEQELLRRAAEERAQKERAAERARQEAELERVAYGEPAFYRGGPRRAPLHARTVDSNSFEDNEADDEEYYRDDPWAQFFGRPSHRPEPELKRARQTQVTPAETVTPNAQSVEKASDSHASAPAPSPHGPAARAPTAEQKIAAATKIQALVRAHQSLTHIRGLDAGFAAAQRAFSFPSIVDFQSGSSSSIVSVPSDTTTHRSGTPGLAKEARLAYTPNNAPLHKYAEDLSRLLVALDEVPSWGSRKVRDARRDVVRRVEAEAQRVEGLWRGLWEAYAGGAEEQDVDILDDGMLADALAQAQAALSTDAEWIVVDPKEEPALATIEVSTQVEGPGTPAAQSERPPTINPSSDETLAATESSPNDPLDSAVVAEPASDHPSDVLEASDIESDSAVASTSSSEDAPAADVVMAADDTTHDQDFAQRVKPVKSDDDSPADSAMQPLI